MAKQREASELEFLRSQNKKMRSQIKQLEKELGRKVKHEHLYQDLEQRQTEEVLEAEAKVVAKDNTFVNKDKCPQCSAAIAPVDLGIRKLVVCAGCGFRRVVKHG